MNTFCFKMNECASYCMQSCQIKHEISVSHYRQSVPLIFYYFKIISLITEFGRNTEEKLFGVHGKSLKGLVSSTFFILFHYFPFTIFCHFGPIAIYLYRLKIHQLPFSILRILCSSPIQYKFLSCRIIQCFKNNIHYTVRTTGFNSVECSYLQIFIHV